MSLSPPSYNAFIAERAALKEEQIDMLPQNMSEREQKAAHPVTFCE